MKEMTVSTMVLLESGKTVTQNKYEAIEKNVLVSCILLETVNGA